ncbi:MAG: hypothetical protein ABIU55_13830 [Ferruginibacter sp.]
MKNVLAILVVLISCASCTNNSTKEPEHNIVGNWDSHYTFQGKSGVLEARFKPDGEYDAFDNGKPFVSGKYRLAGDTIFLKDGLCNIAYEGAYMLTYYKDSVRFAVVEDSCINRNRGTDGLVAKRIASVKKQ